MYDTSLFKQATVARGLNYFRLGKLAGVDPKTAKLVVLTGKGNPDSIYKVAAVLGLDVKKFGDGEGVQYDFSAILKKSARKGA